MQNTLQNIGFLVNYPSLNGVFAWLFPFLMLDYIYPTIVKSKKYTIVNR